MRFGKRALKPFDAGGRWVIGAIFLTFVAMAGLGVALTLSATHRSHDKATVVEIAARQRTLAERYLAEVMLVRAGQTADPAQTATDLSESANDLLNGGTVPAIPGDDDDTPVPAAEGAALRAQLEQEIRLVGDLSANGEALLGRRSFENLPTAGRETLHQTNPIERLRVIVALSSATSLNVARTIAEEANSSVNSLVTTQVLLAVTGLILSLLLAGALIYSSRRRTAHFRILAESASDLVLVVGEMGCRYASPSVVAKLGRPQSDLFGAGYEQFIHPGDRDVIEQAKNTATPAEFNLRICDASGEWRHLEARVTDLRGDRHLRGVVINARDTTERVRLESELKEKARRDGFATQLGEALEMADEEAAVCEVVERAMVDTSAVTPMELLLSDSSRANLRRVATSPQSGAPGCPVRSPFSCVAVRRGSAVVFDSSEELNACPHLRDRPTGSCSAACVPVSFMGRSLGVLHTTGPDLSPLGSEQVERLRTLAAQAGARIGTVRAFERTQLQASTDGLTGLSNRRTAESRLRELLASRLLFAVALIDLDHFKQLNDTHGHEAGDRALRLFSEVAREATRGHDVVARWGGEEFIVVLPELDRFEAVSVLDRLRHMLAKAHPGETPRFTASVGISDSNQARAVETLVHIADNGLYAAKEAGRDRVKIGEPVEDDTNGTRVVAEYPVEMPYDPLEPAPSIQQAAFEEDPQPNGAEIR